MKSKFKRIFSGVLSIVTAISFLPPISVHAGEGAELYPYTIFAGSEVEGAITINADNICINGNIATNGTIASTTSNFNINGTKTEHAEEEMIYFFKKLDYAYFNSSDAEIYLDDYSIEEQNINIIAPLEAEGDVELTGNINISSGIKALDDVILKGNVENSNNSVICSQTGDVLIDTDSVNLNGLVYAPEGCINITAQNLNINSVVMIADTINITCPNLNANYNSGMAEFVGTESEVELDVIAYAEYLSESNTVDIHWYSTVPRGVFEVQTSNDNVSYTTIASVSDGDSYQYTITEDFTQKYVRVVETTYYGENFASIPFIIVNSDNEYEIVLLDSDEDGLPDVVEKSIKTDPDIVDTDGDNLSDFQEYFITQTNPLIYDSVIEGVSDADADCDEDGLSNLEEITNGSNPLIADTDEDGLSDYDEVYVYNTDPTLPDSDNDDVDDESEIKLELDPNNPETFGVPDSQYMKSQHIEVNDKILIDINTTESPYELSIDLTTNRDAEKEMSIVQSGYSSVIENDAMIGASLDISISDKCNPEDIVIRYNIKDEYIANTLNLYSEFDEFSGIKRLNIFKFDEEMNMLLPIDTQFDVENGFLYSEVDELGTYCIMDLEIWLNNLGVEPLMGDNSSDSVVSQDTPLQMMKIANSSWTPMYVNTPIDLVFILQTAGNSSYYFEKEKTLIKEFSQYVFSTNTDVNVYIITYDKIEGEILHSATGNYPFKNLYEITLALNSLSYENNVTEYCDRGQAFRILLNDIYLREDADTFIYQLMNGANISYTSNDNEQVISMVKNNLLTAYSEIGTPGWRYDYASDQTRISSAITTNGDLFLSFDDDTFSTMKEHFEGKKSPERVAYEIIVPTNWKKITLDGELSDSNYIDTDNDELTDWEEVDIEKLVWVDEEHFELPVLSAFDVVSYLKRFDSPEYNYLIESLGKCSFLPILSDPTNEDSDEDLISDEEEIIIGLDPLLSDSDHDNLSDGLEMMIGFDPFNPNPDGDEYRDDVELKKGTDPYSYNINYTLYDHIGAISYGIILGDFADDDFVNIEVLIGQIGGSFVPIVADVRDTIANLSKKNWVMAGLSTIGLAPVAGDTIKAVGNLGEAVRKLGDDIPEITKVIIEVAEKNPKLIKYFSKSDEVVEAIKKASTSQEITKEALEKVVKYADEAGIVIDKTSDIFKKSESVLDTGQDVWNAYGPCKRGQVIDDFLNGHTTGKGLGTNFPVVDRLEDGVLISTKSIDLGSATYKDSEKLEKRLQSYIDKLADFEKKYPKVNTDAGFKWGSAEPLHSSDYTSKVLELVIPDIPISNEQAKVLNEFAEKYGMTVVVMKG